MCQGHERPLEAEVISKLKFGESRNFLYPEAMRWGENEEGPW
jgi:hypothetical protein